MTSSPTVASPALVVGTAGHIDHGKSRLVLALTGTDPDRLPEEKARGMTIDLGFAHTQIDGCDIWFVDVPGHERFIRNMLAGASGIDAALLVVAADDSVMPQTREHAEVLGLLGVQRCVVVLTKMDLVDDDWATQVESETRELLATFGCQPHAVVRTSTETGRGLDELRAVLAGLARARAAESDAPRWFRLPIDRAFTVAGRGTVVTGSVAHGGVQREDELELWPAGQRVRVRDLQSHHDSCAAAAGRMRLALNLAGVSPAEADRGCTLASPGYLAPARFLDVHVAWLRMPGKVRRQRLRLRLHIATTEVLAELRLADAPAADEIRGQFGQLVVAEPIVATWGQRFILRDESGLRTLGGGRVLHAAARLWTTRRPATREGLRMLCDGAPSQRLEAVIRAAEWQPLDDARLATLAGLPDAAVVHAVSQQLMQTGEIRALDSAALRLYVHSANVAALGADLQRRLKTYVQANPRQPGLPRSQWLGWMPSACPARLRPALAEHFIQTKAVDVQHEHIVPVGTTPAMSAEDERLLAQILGEFDTGAFQPPALGGLRCVTAQNQKRVRELVTLATARGELIRIADGLWLHGRRWTQLVQLVSAELRRRGPLTVADIRTLLKSSRKYIVPICERLDAAGVTKRSGDLRSAGPKAAEA